MVNPVMVILATMCSCRSRIIRAAENFPLLCNNNNNNNKAGFCNYLTKQMGSWQKEKENYLAMSAEQKRKGYASWQSIPAWKEFAIKEELPDKISRNTDFQIDNSLNDRLAQKISLFMGDITTLGVDSIVNAANSSLLGGGGVDGAIHRAAGSDLKEECRTLNGCKVGEAKITGGYKLPAKYVIHTVGPQGERPNSLRDCYKNSLDLMLSKKLRTIAFPCISTGIYGYPNEPAAHVAVYAVRKHLEAHSDDVDRIIFCLFLDIDKEIYKAILQSYFPLN